MLIIAGVNLSFDQTITLIGLIVNVMQALVLPITIYLLVVQTRAMRMQITALVEQSKEMTAQTRVFIDTIYSATFQGLYDAEAHIGELMMTYPEASRVLMSPVSKPEGGQSTEGLSDVLKPVDPALREQVRWLGTAMLDFFEHIWTQAKNKGLPLRCGRPGKTIWARCSARLICACSGKQSEATMLLAFAASWIRKWASRQSPPSCRPCHAHR